MKSYPFLLVFALNFLSLKGFAFLGSIHSQLCLSSSLASKYNLKKGLSNPVNTYSSKKEKPSSFYLSKKSNEIDDYPVWKVNKYPGDVKELYDLLNLSQDCTVMDLEWRRLHLEGNWVYEDSGIVKLRKAYRTLKAHMQYERLQKGLGYYEDPNSEEMWTGY